MINAFSFQLIYAQMYLKINTLDIVSPFYVSIAFYLPQFWDKYVETAQRQVLKCYKMSPKMYHSIYECF